MNDQARGSPLSLLMRPGGGGGGTTKTPRHPQRNKNVCTFRAVGYRRCLKGGERLIKNQRSKERDCQSFNKTIQREGGQTIFGGVGMTSGLGVHHRQKERGIPPQGLSCLILMRGGNNGSGPDLRGIGASSKPPGRKRKTQPRMVFLSLNGGF